MFLRWNREKFKICFGSSFSIFKIFRVRRKSPRPLDRVKNQGTRIFRASILKKTIDNDDLNVLATELNSCLKLLSNCKEQAITKAIFVQKKTELIEHLIFYCHKSKQLWLQSKHLLSYFCLFEINFSLLEVMFCYTREKLILLMYWYY